MGQFSIKQILELGKSVSKGRKEHPKVSKIVKFVVVECCKNGINLNKQ